jgi:hypothetical protein
MLPASCLLAAALLGAPAPRGDLEPLPPIRDPEVVELSGLAASRRHPGVFWGHNDSGHPPRLLALDTDGRLLHAFPTSAPNLDWEDLALDGRGRLHVADIGNNLRLLPTRTIYVFDEPDPAAPPGADPLLPVQTLTFAYPDRRPFDAEALAVDGDRLLLLSKERGTAPARLFTVAIPGEAGAHRVTLEPAGTLQGFEGQVTAADLSPDGRHLLVVGYDRAAVFERAGDPPRWTKRSEVRHDLAGCEAAAWDGADAILATEAGERLRWRDAAGPTP